MRILGIILIVLGLVGLLYGGITYTRKEKVVDIGPFEATTERRETIPLPPLVGALLFAGGIGLMIASRKR